MILLSFVSTARFAGISAKQREITVSPARFSYDSSKISYKELIKEPRSPQTETARFAGLIFLI